MTNQRAYDLLNDLAKYLTELRLRLRILELGFILADFKLRRALAEWQKHTNPPVN